MTINLMFASDAGEMTVRFYLGVEYECPRGHRFFCSSPDKLFKAPTSGVFKVKYFTLSFNFMDHLEIITGEGVEPFDKGQQKWPLPFLDLAKLGHTLSENWRNGINIYDPFFFFFFFPL